MKLTTPESSITGRIRSQPAGGCWVKHHQRSQNATTGVSQPAQGRRRKPRRPPSSPPRFIAFKLWVAPDGFAITLNLSCYVSKSRNGRSPSPPYDHSFVQLHPALDGVAVPLDFSCYLTKTCGNLPPPYRQFFLQLRVVFQDLPLAQDRTQLAAQPGQERSKP